MRDLEMTPESTTSETLVADLRASLICTDLKGRGYEPWYAERTAKLCVSLTDPSAYDAALWKGAEALYDQMDPHKSDLMPLSARPIKERARYLLLAIQCVAWVRLALERGFPAESLQQAWADLETHKMELAERRHIRSVQ